MKETEIKDKLLESTLTHITFKDPETKDWDNIAHFIKTTSSAKHITIKMKSTELNQAIVYQLAHALAMATSIYHFEIELEDASTWLKEEVYSGQTKFEIQRQHWLQDAPHFTSIAGIIQKNDYLQSFSLSSKEKPFKINLLDFTHRNQSFANFYYCYNQLKCLSLDTSAGVSFEPTLSPTGHLDLASVASGRLRWLKLSSRASTTPSKQSIQVVITDRALLSQKRLFSDENFYRKLFRSYSCHILTTTRLVQPSGLWDLDEKIKDLPTVFGSARTILDQLPKNIRPETVFIVDASVRRKIISNTLLIKSKHSWTRPEMRAIALPGYDLTDNNFPTHLQALEYQTDHLILSLPSSETTKLDDFLHEMKLCVRLKSLIVLGDGSTDFWSEENEDKVISKFSSPILPNLQFLNILIDKAFGPHLILHLMQQPYDLELNCKQGTPLSTLLKLPRQAKKSVNTVLNLRVDGEIFDQKLSESLTHCFNPQIRLKKLYLHQCTLSAFFFEALKQLSKQPGVSIEVILNQCALQDCQPCTDFIGKKGIVSFQYLDMASPKPSELKELSTPDQQTVSMASEIIAQDAPTADSQERKIKVLQTVMGKELDKDLMTRLTRIHVHENIVLQGDLWSVSATLVASELKQLTDHHWLTPEKVSAIYHAGSRYHYGKFTAEPSADRFQPLPSYLTPEELLGASVTGCDPENIHCYYNAHTGQYFVKLKEATEECDVKITYVLKPKPLTITDVSRERCQQLPESIASLLHRITRYFETAQKSIESIPEAFVPFAQLLKTLKEEKEPSKKLAAIINYCQIGNGGQFKDAALEPQPAIDDFITLMLSEIPTLSASEKAAIKNTLNILIQRRGVCRHAAISAVILCRFAGIPARAWSSLNHLMLEAPSMEGEGADWQSYDLGGGSGITFDCQALAEPAVPSRQETDDDTVVISHHHDEKSAVKNTSTADSTESMMGDYADYRKQYPPILTLETLVQTICATQGHLRIACNHESEMYGLAQKLATADQKPQPVWIIRELSELTVAKTPALNGMSPAEGSLAYALKQSAYPATLVINLSGFKVEELAHLNNLLDKPDNTQLKIILLHQPTQLLEDSLIARTHYLDYQPRVASPSPKIFESIAALDCKSPRINVTSQDPASAYIQLFGHFSCTEAGWQWQPGKIYDAIIKKQPLVISKALLNQPTFRHELSKIWVSNRYITPFHQSLDAKNLLVYSSDQLAPFPDTVKMKLYATPPSGVKKTFYLNPSTFRDFVNQCTIDEKGVHYGGEILRHYTDDDLICISGNMTGDQLQEMANFISQLKSTDTPTSLHFYAEKGITLPQEVPFEKVDAEMDETDEDVEDDPSISAMSMPIQQAESMDAYDRQYQDDIKQGYFCYTVSTRTNYDLFNVIRVSEDKDEDKESTFYIRGTASAVIQQLRQGKTVVLYGELPTDLSECTQSLLGTPAYFKGETLSGKLRWVKPPATPATRTIAALDDEKKSDIHETITTALSTQQFICITGPTGAGKTHAISQFTQDKTVYRAHQLTLWLEKGGILYLDEANREADGDWDFLRDAVLGGHVLYQGVVYTITKQHQVIVTQNPSHYPGCQPHLVFERYFSNFALPAMTAESMKAAITARLQAIQSELASTQIDSLWEIILLAQTTIARLMRHYPFTLRDCFAVIAATLDFTDPIAVARATVLELGSIFQHRTDQTDFIATIAAAASVAPATLLAPTRTEQTYLDRLREQKYFIPPEREWLAIQVIHFLENARAKPGKKSGLILEGSSGTGKTKLIHELLMLLKLPYVQIDPHTVLSQDPASFQKSLLEAFHAGQAVVIDELNLLNEAQLGLLLQLLEGRDHLGQPAKKPGFMLLATQNPATAAEYFGRNSTSAALINRCKRLNLFDYQPAALEELAKNQLPTREEDQDPSLAAQITLVFEELRQYCQQTGKPIPNYRLFFEACTHAREEKTHSPGKILAALIQHAGLTLQDREVSLIMTRISSRLNKPKSITPIVIEEVQLISKEEKEEKKTEGHPSQKSTDEPESVQPLELDSLEDLLTQLQHHPERSNSLITTALGSLKESQHDLFSQVLANIVLSGSVSTEMGLLMTHSEFMKKVIGNERRQISNNLAMMQQHKITNQPEVFSILLSASIDSYRRVRSEEPESTTAQIPFWGSGRSRTEKLEAARVLKQALETTSTLFNHSDDIKSVQADEKKALDAMRSKTLLNFQLDTKHYPALQSGQLKELYLAWVSTVCFTRSQLQQRLTAVTQWQQLLPIMLQYLVSRVSQVTDYTSFTGSINPWSSSKTQKCAAAKLIWNWMDERKTTATRDDWQSLTQLLSEQKLTTAAQKGDLGLIYQKLQTMIR